MSVSNLLVSKVQRGGQQWGPASAAAPVAQQSAPGDLAPAASRVINREQVMAAIAQLPEARLVLFAAPAGSGKTMAMRQYRQECRRSGVATAWVEINECDNDLERFQRVLSGSLSQLRARAVPGSPQISASKGKFAVRFVDGLAAADGAFALFMDDFEAIHNPAILDLVQSIIALLPWGGRLCLASRRAPALQLGGLRARGQLLEIDPGLLRFSLEETQSFLEKHLDARLMPEEVAKLYQDTQGWPAIVWLAIGAMKAQRTSAGFIADFNGSNAAVAEFFSQELLQEQAPEVQEFLLRASILRELNESLCNAVCRVANGSAILRQLDAAQTFITPLEPRALGFRFQPLSGAFLRDRLDRVHPDEIADLHLRSARWYHTHGRLAPAMEHALSSGNSQFAVSLLLPCVESLLCQGRSRQLTRWFDSLPAAATRPHYNLRVAYIWALTTIRRSHEAMRHLDELTQDTQQLMLTADLKLELGILRSCILAMVDRAADGAWLVREELSRLPGRASLVRRIMVTTLAVWKVASNQFGDAIRLAQMFDYKDAQGSTSSSYYTTFVEGTIAFAQCHVREAAAHFRVALQDATTAFKSIVAIHLAEALYEIDELAEAKQLLAAHSPAVLEFGRSDHLILSQVLQARIAHAEGDVDTAFLRLSEMEHIARTEHLPRVLASAQLERARMAMCSGNLAEAQDHLQRASDPEAWRGLRGNVMPANDVETTALGRYRTHIVMHAKDDVISALQTDIKTAQACQRHRRALRFNLQLARILHASGQPRPAMRTLERALRNAMQDGLIRPFIDEGAPIIDLLRAFRKARQTSVEHGQDAPLTSLVDRILTRAGDDLESDADQADDAVAGAPVLTAKEMQTLNALASGLSNIEIAARLFVSETTVRSHLRKISVKLGTSSRTQAVCVARNFGLV
jgi:LuxR family maltose regulon positive regulatory protein